MNQNKVIPAIIKKLIAKKMSMLRMVFSTVFCHPDSPFFSDSPSEPVIKG